ncbi:MAG TPA: hypothetical protein VFN74_17725, partial [Chloroflexota bacterium]|nr:hypothetical protein [Chloroflexota bacterium]
DGTYFYALEPYNGSTPRYEASALWRGMSLFDDPALVISPGDAVLGATEEEPLAEEPPAEEPPAEPEPPPVEPAQPAKPAPLYLHMPV